MDTTHILISVDNGNMADDRFHPLVDRCKDDDMAAGIGNAPGPDLVGVDRRVALEEADGVLIIPDLRPGIQMLAIVAATDPEVAIVDDERVKAIFSELLRIGRHRDLTHIAPAASEHDSGPTPAFVGRSEEHTSELQSLMRISYAVFCLKKKKITTPYAVTNASPHQP